MKEKKEKKGKKEKLKSSKAPKNTKKSEKNLRKERRERRAAKRDKQKYACHIQGFNEMLAEVAGLELVDMEGDGNCLFRSISHQLLGHQNSHGSLRALCSEYMGKHKDTLSLFLDKDDDMDFDSYVNWIAKEGKWAGYFELYCFSLLFEVNFLIIQSQTLIPINHFPEGSVATLILSFHNEDGIPEHYNSVSNQNSMPLEELKKALEKAIKKRNQAKEEDSESETEIQEDSENSEEISHSKSKRKTKKEKKKEKKKKKTKASKKDCAKPNDSDDESNETGSSQRNMDTEEIENEENLSTKQKWAKLKLKLKELNLT